MTLSVEALKEITNDLIRSRGGDPTLRKRVQKEAKKESLTGLYLSMVDSEEERKRVNDSMRILFGD